MRMFELFREPDYPPEWDDCDYLQITDISRLGLPVAVWDFDYYILVLQLETVGDELYRVTLRDRLMLAAA